MIKRAAIGLKTMGKCVHASACGDKARHTNGQFGVANRDRRQQLRMKDDFLGDVEQVIQNGIKETHDDVYHHKGRVDGVIKIGLKT